MRLFAFALTLVVAAPALAQPEWYATDALLASLRPEERARVTRQAGLREANELPLYSISVDIADDLRSFTLDETAWVTNRAGRPLTELVFRIFVNATVPDGRPPWVELIEGECLDGVSCTVSAVSPSAIVVRPAQPLPNSARLRVRMRLRGRMQEIAPERNAMMAQGMESLGMLTGGHEGGDYGLLSHSERVASMAYFFPVLARMGPGRWEERDASTLGDLGNDELAHVEARIRVAPGTRVVASGLVTGPQDAGGRAEYVAHAGFVRDFALLASPRFQSGERRVGGVVVRSTFVDGDAEAGQRVLDVAASSLDIFTRRFGPYPYTELDVVEAPLVGGAGGVEFSGLVTVAMMFYRPTRAGGLLAALGGADLENHRRAALELVTAHEFAHQWWHGLVGSDSRRHPYQDECLAQWSALLYLEERYGEERARQEAERQVAANYHMMRMMGRPDGPVDRPVSAFADSLSYAGLVYGKGPFVYRALRSQLGDRAFFAALSDYVREHRFRMAPPRALFDRMARGRHRAAVRAIERRWLDETHGDADLGQPDPGRLLGGSSEMSEALRRMLRSSGGEAEGLMRQLMQTLGGDQSDGAAEGLMRQLLQTLGEAP